MLLLLLILGRTTNASESVSCLDNIIARYFEKNVVLATEGDVLHQYITMDSLKDRAVILYRNEKPNMTGFPPGYDLVVLGWRNVRDLFLMFRGKHQGKIVAAIEHNAGHFARHIISILWDATRAVDVIVTVPTGNTSVEVYSWFPYRERECSQVKEVVLMDTWRDGSFLLGRNLFPAKIKNDLNGCPLHVMTRPIKPHVFPSTIHGQYVKGNDVMIVDELIRKFNMSLKMVIPTDPATFWMNERHGVYYRLLNHEIDLAFGGMMARAERYQMADATYPYLIEELLWLYPKPSFDTHFFSIYTVFSLKLWFAVILFHVSIAMTFFLTARRLVREIRYRGFIACFFNAVAILCNTSAPPPRNPFLRFLVMSYVIYALHLSAAYQSYLIVLLTGSEDGEPFRNVYQLAETEMSINLFGPSRHLYNETDHEAWTKILRPGRMKYFEEPQIPDIINDIAVNRSSCILFPRTALRFLTRAMYIDGGESLFEYLNHLTYSLTMYLSPGHPLRNPFSDHILALNEAGLFKYWEREAIASAGREEGYELKAIGNELENPQPLGMKHLEGAFLLLALSLSLSFIAFLAEVFHHRLFRKLLVEKRKRLFRKILD